MTGSFRPPFPSAPSDPALRRLGVGPSGGNARPLRAQLIVIVVLALTLLAVPLYLMRRPSAKPAGLVDAGTVPSASASSAPGPVPSSPVDSGNFEPERIKLSEIRKVRCGASARQASEGEACEALPAFEKALIAAVKTTADCAPRSNKPGTINFVLEIDFTRKKLHVFPGASGEWRGPKARRATKCTIDALVAPDWAATMHQYRYYQIAVMATYAPNIGPGAVK
jgi:hypothetical protein